MNYQEALQANVGDVLYYIAFKKEIQSKTIQEIKIQIIKNKNGEYKQISFILVEGGQLFINEDKPDNEVELHINFDRLVNVLNSYLLPNIDKEIKFYENRIKGLHKEIDMSLKKTERFKI